MGSCPQILLLILSGLCSSTSFSPHGAISSNRFAAELPLRRNGREVRRSWSLNTAPDAPVGVLETDSVPCITSVHLLSLQYPDDSNKNNPRLFSKRLKEVWKWKDAVLGDGRDFFVPKPKTLKKIQSVFIKRNSKGLSRNRSRSSVHSDSILTIDECAILSNCARLEIMLVVSTTIRNDERVDAHRDQELDNILKAVVSNTLLDQVRFYQSMSFPGILQEQLKKLDRPSVIYDYDSGDYKSENSSSPSSASSSVNDLRNYWDHVQGSEDVCRYLCLVAAGMAIRPNRPSKAVEFRPFSSRDAHILLQIKRTMEGSTGNICQKILQSALTAGKACRNIDKVPEIQVLKPGIMGYTKNDELRAKEAALEKAIEPTVQECVNSIVAAGQSQRIQDLRVTVMSWSTNEHEAKWLRKQLHKPTMELRKNLPVEGEIKESSRSDGLVLASLDLTIKQLQKDFQSWRQVQEFETTRSTMNMDMLPIYQQSSDSSKCL